MSPDDTDPADYPDAVDVPLPARQPAIRIMTMPADTNPAGAIFGGWLMSHVDVAGSIEALRIARGPVATVAVNAFQFRQPLWVGDLVSFYADVIKIGRTSVTVAVEVFAQRNPQNPQCVKVTEAVLTYVAVGPDKRPRPIAQAQADSEQATTPTQVHSTRFDD